MICCNEIPEVVNYGSSASYCCLPTPEQVANGVVPLDSLPAAWWNAMWAETNRAVNCARGAVGSLITELNTVLTQAGVCACATCTDQLYQSINKIRQRIADSSTPGAVKSSSTCGQVSVNASGIMTANGLGNTACLNTTSKEATGAINELKSTYDTCWSNNTTALGGKAPTAHASSATTYGVGTSANYGHLKISDTYTSVLSACSGVAASQKAANCIYAVANAKAAVGDTAGCALGTAAAGSATTAARSDHVHPKPTQVDCSCKSYLTSFAASADRPVMVTCPSCCNYQIVGYSTACPLTFNPATGEVKAKTFTGAFNGTANNATCFGGCTYACAKANILSGNAASATNATCFGGCTYACAKADILKGCAADSAKLGGTAATCYLLKTGCAADSANLGGTAAACYLLKTGCAADSAKLGGTAAACYALKTDCAPDSANLGGTAAACYALKTGCVCCAGANGSGTAFGSAATCAADCFAPTAHASADTTYGAGDASNYGHVKVCDNYTSSGGKAANSVAASSCAVYAAYTAARCLGNATCYSKLTAAACTEAGAADCAIILGLARSFRWCCCTTNICSYDRRTYTKIGTYQCQHQGTGLCCEGYTYLDTCVWQCCYSGTAGCTTCTNRRFYFHSNGMFCAPEGLSGATTCTTNIVHRDTGASKVSNINFCVSYTNTSSVATPFEACICGANGRYYGSGAVFSNATYGCALEIIRNAASGGAAICFRRQTTGLGSIAFTAADTLVRYKTDASACYQILDCSMAGSAVGNVAVVGTALGTTANKIVLTTAEGKLKPSTNAVGSAAYCTAGAAVGNVPLVGTALGTTADKIVLTTAEGKLKPSANAVGGAAYCAVGTAASAVPKIGTALSANDGYLVVTNASGNLKNIAGINVYCGTTCKCSVHGAKALCLGSNAFNSTAFTTCTGTVTVADKASSTDCTPIALCTGAKTVGKSTGCALTFDTCNGILRVNCLAGVARRTACVPMFTNHYPEASAMYNRPIVPYLATPTSMDICCQCTCQSVTTFKIPTPFSCTYVQSCTDYDFDIKVYCYYGAVIKVQSTYTAGVCHTVCIGTAGLRTGDSYKVFMRIMNPEVTCGSCKRTCDYSGTGCTTVWHCLGRIKCNNTLCINVSYYEYDGFSINQCDPYNRPVQPVLAYADCYADGQSYIPPINI